MLIYMDLCCFNRPFDDQRSPIIYLETEAKLFVQDAIKNGVIQVCWSYILSYENAAKPDRERRDSIGKWEQYAQTLILENDSILQRSNALKNQGFGLKDALHIGCAIEAKAAFFLTTDKGIIRKKSRVTELEIINPTEFLQYLEQQT